jgi:hypothetical protein
MDESGCLGFDFKKTKTSRNFIVSFVFCKNRRQLDRIVKIFFKSFPDKSRKGHIGVLHANKELPKTKLKLLSLLKETDVSIMFN